MFEKVFVAAFAAAQLVAAAQPIKSIRFERTVCYGTCPAYSVTIYDDGRLEYRGGDYVKNTGFIADRISPEEFKKLARRAEKIGFFSLEDYYGDVKIGDSMTTVTDLPTTIVIVTRGAESKKIEDYMGAPKRLHDFEQLIEKTTKPGRWTGHSDVNEFADVPYYEKFPINRTIAFRGVLQRTWTGEYPDKMRPSDCLFTLPNNPGVSFTLKPRKQIDLRKFSGYLVEARGTLSNSQAFMADSVRPIRRVFEDKDIAPPKKR